MRRAKSFTLLEEPSNGRPQLTDSAPAGTAGTADITDCRRCDRRRPAEGETFKPYVPDESRMPEFTIQAVVVGTAGAHLSASSLYLVLRSA